ncbi:MAG: hypothetical protein L0H73_02210 [Nitrococcus sp.]|nr:hypothetical protein [Nitrococcus sp.]
MSDSYFLWTHGVNVIPEYTKEYTGTDNGLYMRRAGFYAIIRQNGGTENWFHFPIPTPTWLDDNKVEHYHAFLRGYVYPTAAIDLVHVRESRDGYEAHKIYDSDEKDPIYLNDGQFEVDFNLEDRSCTGPLVMCVHVKFIDEANQVMFTGAGGSFEEQSWS